MDNLLVFYSRDGLFQIDIDKIAYFEANGNYTIVVAKNKLKASLAMGLSRTEQEIVVQLGEKAGMFMRVGKRFIVNLKYVYSVNIAKQNLVLSDLEHFAFQLPMSKEALRQMKILLINKNNDRTDNR